MINIEGTSIFLFRFTFIIVRLIVYIFNDQIIISFIQIIINIKFFFIVNEKRKVVIKRNKNQIENKNKEKEKNNMNVFRMKLYVEMSLLYNYVIVVRMQRLSYRVIVCRIFEIIDSFCVVSLKIVFRDDICQNRNNFFIIVCIMFIVIFFLYIERNFVSLWNMLGFL